MAKLPADINPNKLLQDLALDMTVLCVRNTVIETYHDDGKLSNPEMCAFNKEVVDRIYTVLRVLLDPQLDDARGPVLAWLKHNRPDGWDEPRLDVRMIHDISPKIDALVENELHPRPPKSSFLGLGLSGSARS